MTIVYAQIMKSDLENKRLKSIFYDQNRKKIKSTNFGLRGGSTFIDHKDVNKKYAWIARHEVKGKFKDFTSASSLSYHLLWNKPTLSASFNDYLRKFNLQKF